MKKINLYIPPARHWIAASQTSINNKLNICKSIKTYNQLRAERLIFSFYQLKGGQENLGSSANLNLYKNLKCNLKK